MTSSLLFLASSLITSPLISSSLLLYPLIFSYNLFSSLIHRISAPAPRPRSKKIPANALKHMQAGGTVSAVTLLNDESMINSAVSKLGVTPPAVPPRKRTISNYDGTASSSSSSATVGVDVDAAGSSSSNGPPAPPPRVLAVTGDHSPGSEDGT